MTSLNNVSPTVYTNLGTPIVSINRPSCSISQFLLSGVFAIFKAIGELFTRCFSLKLTDHVYTINPPQKTSANYSATAIKNHISQALDQVNNTDYLEKRAKEKLQLPLPEISDDELVKPALSIHDHAINRIQKDLGRLGEAGSFTVKEREKVGSTTIDNLPDDWVVAEGRSDRDIQAKRKYTKEILPLFNEEKQWADLCCLMVGQNLSQALNTFTEEVLKDSTQVNVIAMKQISYKEDPAEVTILRDSRTDKIASLYIEKTITQEIQTETGKIRIKKTLTTTVSIPENGNSPQIEFDSLLIQHHVDIVP